MDLPAFRSFVEQRSELFEGVHRESEESLAAAELRLGFPLPSALRWLLQEWGYSECCGIDALDEAVEVTLACREQIGLPHRYFVINDWGDGGVVYLDFETGRVRAWADGAELHDLATAPMPVDDMAGFDNYSAFVVYLVERNGEPDPSADGNL